MKDLNVGDQLKLSDENGRVVILEVLRSEKPPEPDTELVSVVFKDLTPREAGEYHLGMRMSTKRYIYRAPKAWNLKIGDQPYRESTRVTVVGFPAQFDRPGHTLRDLSRAPSGS